MAAKKKKKPAAKKKASPSTRKKKKKAAPAPRKKSAKKKAAPKKKKAAPAKKKARASSSFDSDKTPVKTPIPGAGAEITAPAGLPIPTTRPIDKSGAERREHLRVPYGAWVTVMRGGRQTFCLARDLSSGGMFLKSEEPPPLGEEVKLLIVIENDRSPLELRGLVVRRSESEQGFGVRFMGIDSMSATRVRDLVADASAGLWRPPHESSQAPRDDS